jgi:predicted nucleic acid-binding protein
MAYPFLDTDIIIRFLTGDDLAKQAAAAALFARIERGSTTVAAPVTVIADAVYVLHSHRLYNKSRAEVATLLIPLVRLANVRIPQRRILLRALELYGQSASGFGDAMLLAAMESAKATILYSYDEGFDRVPGITREEPVIQQ